MSDGGAVGWWSFGGLGSVGRPVVDPSKVWSATFTSLVELMINGTANDRLRGDVRARIDQPSRVDFSYRVSRRGELVRCETLDGRVHFIAGHDTVWTAHDPDSSEPVVSERTDGSNPALDDFGFGAGRPRWERWWEGDDFTIPTRPETEATFLGRPAWEIELAPPAHKPFPMQMIVDVQTGLILREGNAAFGTFHEWTRLDTDADLSDDLFTFDPSADRLAAPVW